MEKLFILLLATLETGIIVATMRNGLAAWLRLKVGTITHFNYMKNFIKDLMQAIIMAVLVGGPVLYYIY